MLGVCYVTLYLPHLTNIILHRSCPGHFSWYKHMDGLMGTSPVVSKAALTHSASHIALSVLSHDGGGDDVGSEKGSSDNGDEPPHQIHSYTLLFLLFL